MNFKLKTLQTLRHLFSMCRLLLLQPLLGGPQPLLQLSAVCFLLSQLAPQILELLLSCSAGSCERAVWTLLETKHKIKSDKNLKTFHLFCLTQTYCCSFVSFQLSYLLVERRHLGFGPQFEFGEASLRFLFLILWTRSNKSISAQS